MVKNKNKNKTIVIFDKQIVIYFLCLLYDNQLDLNELSILGGGEEEDV